MSDDGWEFTTEPVHPSDRESKVQRAGRLVREAYAEVDPTNPYAECKITEELARENLILLSTARRVTAPYVLNAALGWCSRHKQNTRSVVGNCNLCLEDYGQFKLEEPRY